MATSPGGLNSQVEEVLSRSFDLHVHAGPDAGRERRVDALEAARDAQEAGMAGFVLKNHDYPTASLAYALNRMYPGLEVAGSICLNQGVGGLNPRAVEVAARLGARVVWMPTIDAFGRSESGRAGVRVVDDGGRLVPAAAEVLDLVQEHRMVLASGHLAPGEVMTLFAAARERRIEGMIATHPAAVATVEEMREIAALGAYVEFTFLSCMPSSAGSTPGEMAGQIGALGVEHCVVTSDFGQAVNPPPAEGMRMAIASLIQAGMDPDEVSILVARNPARLMGGPDSRCSR